MVASAHQGKRFPFSPKLVFIFGDYVNSNRYTGEAAIFWGPSGLLVSSGAIFGFNYFVSQGEAGFTWHSTGISFYSVDLADRQLNKSSKTYHWVAIG